MERVQVTQEITKWFSKLQVVILEGKNGKKLNEAHGLKSDLTFDCTGYCWMRVTPK